MLRPLSVVRHTVLLFVYFIAIAAQAQIFNGAVSISTGGSGRAAVEAGDSLFLNPATLVHLKGKNLHSSMSGQDWALSFSDNSPDSMLPAGFSYTQKSFLDGKTKLKDAAITLSDYIGKKFSVGVTIHNLTVGDELISYNQTNANIGFAFVPRTNHGFGLVFYDVVPASKDIPVAYQSTPRAGLGYNYIYKTFLRVRADLESGAQNSWEKPVLMAGLESYMNPWLVFRLGYRQNTQLSRSFGTLGLGFDGPVFKLNYAYAGDDEISNEARHSVDLAIPF